MFKGLGFEGLGSGVQEFRVQGFRVQTLGCRTASLRLEPIGLFRMQGLKTDHLISSNLEHHEKTEYVFVYNPGLSAESFCNFLQNTLPVFSLARCMLPVPCAVAVAAPQLRPPEQPTGVKGLGGFVAQGIACFCLPVFLQGGHATMHMYFLQSRHTMYGSFPK